MSTVGMKGHLVLILNQLRRNGRRVFEIQVFVDLHIPSFLIRDENEKARSMSINEIPNLIKSTRRKRRTVVGRHPINWHSENSVIRVYAQKKKKRNIKRVCPPFSATGTMSGIFSKMPRFPTRTLKVRGNRKKFFRQKFDVWASLNEWR